MVFTVSFCTYSLRRVYFIVYFGNFHCVFLENPKYFPIFEISNNFK